MNDFERCLRFVETVEAQSADLVAPFSFGRAFVNRELPIVWDINFLRVERRGATWDELAAAAEEIQGGAGLHHRKLYLRDEPGVDDILNAARGSGWEVIPLIFMIRRRAGERDSDAPVRELEQAEMRVFREELARRQPWATHDEDVRQVLEATRRLGERVHARFFVAEVDGEIAAGCDLYRGPGLAQIEDVETKEEYRNRGLATAVVLAAARAAHEDQPDPLIFLTADENDWPKALYERMGFETVGRRYSLLKTNL